MARQYFGTDGVRGRVGIPPMTADFVLKLGWAAGRVLAKEGKPLVLIGKDTRLSGYMFESALQAGLAAAGINIRLLGPMPTPAVAYLTRTFRASAGIVISASHNPHYDNGVKFFSGQGMKLPDDVEEEIEAAMALPLTSVKPDKLGKAERVDDAPGRYIEYCKRTIPSRSSLKGLRIVVDCANGAAYHTAPSVFEELGAEVIPIAVQPDGCNINHHCGATSLTHLQETVSQYRADIGIALDGDADRLMMVDKKGEVVDGDEALAIIAKHYHSRGRLKGDVVGTQMSNLGLEVAMKRMGVGFQRAKVGDRYVMEMLKEHGGILGGESSGHILVLDRATTGDGTVSALQILQTMVDSGQPLHELKQVMQKYPQTLINVPIKQRIDLSESKLIQDAVATAEAQLGDRGRVLLRPSGTEPLIRVMVEAEDQSETKQLANNIAAAVKEASVIND